MLGVNWAGPPLADRRNLKVALERRISCISQDCKDFLSAFRGDYGVLVLSKPFLELLKIASEDCVVRGDALIFVNEVPALSESCGVRVVKRRDCVSVNCLQEVCQHEAVASAS